MSGDRKIRVLEMIDDASVGGGQVHLLMIAKYLDRRRFEVSVACEEAGFLVDQLRSISVPVFPVSLDNRFGTGALRGVRRLLQEQRFDVLHTHGGTAGFWGRLGALAFPRPIVKVHTYHGLHYLTDQRRFRSGHKIVDHLLAHATDGLICVCQADFIKGMDAGLLKAGRAEVIHSGIEIEKFRPAGARDDLRSKLGAGDASVVFANVGRLHVQKGQHYLLTAFQAVHRRRPGSLLWIVGEGTLRAQLEQTARDLGVEAAVRFLGARTDIPDVLSATDVFVLSSLWEGQPITLLEAMAAGKPVVASAVDGVLDIIMDGENGLLVSPKDADALASAMLRIGWDRSLMSRLSERSIATVTEQFSASMMARKVGDLYERLYRSRLDSRNKQNTGD